MSQAANRAIDWLATRFPVSSYVRIATVAFLILLVATTPGIFTPRSLITLLNSAALVGCVAIGMTFVTVSGNILSFALGASVGLCAITCAALSGFGVLASILGALAVGIVFNLLQGVLVGLLKANSLIVTIAAATLAGGLAEIATGGQAVYAEPGSLDGLKAPILSVPMAGVILLLAALLGQFILKHTLFGQQLTMQGSNARAAAAAGIRTGPVTMAAYALAGAFASLTGILAASRYGAGLFEYGTGYDYSAIAGVLVGGTSIVGGEGSVWATLLGVFLIATLSTVLLLRGFSTQMQLLATGVLVLAAVLSQGQWHRS
jgi:ribose/xylose/arabinose/galactoside ABC-type transport system permease subunit